jgi:hypothetical protein
VPPPFLYSSGWELAYNHYVGRLGLAMPETAQLIANNWPDCKCLQLAGWLAGWLAGCVLLFGAVLALAVDAVNAACPELT